MKLTILGSANAGGMPVYGCDCAACQRALGHPEFRRGPCSALLETAAGRVLLDAGLADLKERFPPGSLSHILLTHYHMDHVHGLFPLRWGVGAQITVIGPDDPAGCDDLYERPGILDFGTKAKDRESFRLFDLDILPLALNHSRPTLGYRVRHEGRSLAYLTDTIGLPEQTLALLQDQPPDLLVLDCSFPPRPADNRIHNALNDALAIHEAIRPERTLLTHIDHALDRWLMDHADTLPDDMVVAYDGMILSP